LIAKVEQIKAIKKQMPTDIGKLIEGLLDAYAKLLQATNPRQEKSRRGARSLMSVCLQKIPAYIELEEYFAELDRKDVVEEGEPDLSDEIYTYLGQTFGTTNGTNWRHFKQIVRAHGTSLLCDAIADEVLGLESLHAVVDLCMKDSAWDEAEKFLWTYLPVLDPIPIPTNLRTNMFDQSVSVFLYLANAIIERTGRHGFLFDLLEHMVSQETLPLEWLATECMRPIWGRLVRTLSDGDHRAYCHAIRFLETTICAAAGLPDNSIFQDGEVDVVLKQLNPSVRQELRDALNTTFSSLLTVLTSVALASQSRDQVAEQDTVQRLTWILDSVVIGLLTRNDIRSDLELLNTTTENMQTFAQRALWVTAASLLIHLGGCSLALDMVSLNAQTLLKAFGWVTYQYSCHDIDIPYLLGTLPTFISSIARCSGKAWQEDGFNQLQRLVNSLLCISSERLPHKLWNTKRLAIEACLEFAQATNNKDHFAYTREVEQQLSSEGRLLLAHSPQKDDSPSTSGGFRWEEGMGEWVACTPFVKQASRPVPRKLSKPLEFLPSPEPTDSSQFDEDVEDDESDEDQCPQSSPVKKAPRTSTSSLGKRTRAVSTKGTIPNKSCRLTAPGPAQSSFRSSSLTATSNSHSRNGRQRSSHTKEPKAVRNGLRTMRSRSSLESSLRQIAPKRYTTDCDSSESESETSDDSEDSEDEEEQADERDELGQTPAVMKTKLPDRNTKTRGPQKLQWAFRAVDVEEESDDELSFQ
jgi:hypothetical protein